MLDHTLARLKLAMTDFSSLDSRLTLEILAGHLCVYRIGFDHGSNWIIFRKLLVIYVSIGLVISSTHQVLPSVSYIFQVRNRFKSVLLTFNDLGLLQLLVVDLCD